MWETRIDVLSEGHLRRVAVLRDGAAVSYAEVVEQLRTSRPFRIFFTALLADPPYQACFWEMPPVTQATAARAFECVLVDSPGLADMAPEPAAFAGHFTPAQAVATFANLGGDAVAGRLSSEPLWLSTSGLGVAWLHVRLDQQPKYYTYAPYRIPEGEAPWRKDTSRSSAATWSR